MKAIFDTLVGRAILVILAGVLIVQLSSQLIYEAALLGEAAVANRERLIQRVLSIYETLERLPAEARDAQAHDLSSGVVEAHWGTKARAQGAIEGDWGEFRDELIRRLSGVGHEGVIVGGDGSANATLHVAMISMMLPDKTWLNVGILTPHVHPPRPWLATITTSIIALLVMLGSALLVHWLSQPLRRMAAAARAFHLGGSSSLVPTVGPYEVRALAAAFNEMQSRVLRQIKARVQALAAVSHDLKTPLMRMRLRLEEVRDRNLRQALEHDLSEMERMIEATLNYLRGDRASEEVQSVELVALVGSILDEASDMGEEVSLDAPSTVVVRGRRLALKRAITNIVHNAVKYGDRADVTISVESDDALIAIRDGGPGVAPDQIDALFEPFVRLETSRNEQTGGFGLGLTIASEIVRAHDGTIALRNRPEGGLEALIKLPLRGSARNIL